MKKSWLVLLLVLIFIVSLGARFYDLEMDHFSYNQYGMGYLDEGGYSTNARNKVLFGTWELPNEVWSSVYLSPVFTFLQYLPLSKLGVSMQSMKLTPALLGIISTMLSSLLIFLKNKRAGMIFFTLLSLNVMLIAYSRVATLQILAIALITVMLSLLVYNSKFSWFVTGMLVPTLFFSTITTLFFLGAIGLSVVIHSLFRKKSFIKKVAYLVLGALISCLLWLLWLIPNFSRWKFMLSIMGSHKLGLSFFKLVAVPQHALKFFLLHPIIVVIALTAILLIVVTYIKNKKINFVDLLCLTSLAMFLAYTLTVDFFLRRWVMILPIVILLATKALAQIGDCNFSFKGKNVHVTKNAIILIILGIYVLMNTAVLADHFGQGLTNYQDSHTVIRNSQELTKYIPAQANVFGDMAIALIYENDFKPYYLYMKSKYLTEQEALLLPLFYNETINHAVLRYDFNNEQDKIQESKVYQYIADNFEVIAVLDGKYWIDNSLRFPIYVHGRKS